MTLELLTFISYLTTLYFKCCSFWVQDMTFLNEVFLQVKKSTYSIMYFPLSKVHPHFQYQFSDLRPPMHFFPILILFPLCTYLLMIYPLTYPSIHLYTLFAQPVSQASEPQKTRNSLTFPFFTSPGFQSLSPLDRTYALMILLMAPIFCMYWCKAGLLF